MKKTGLINNFLSTISSQELQLVLLFLTQNSDIQLTDKEIDTLENHLITIKKLLSQ